jgi:1-acyl-sn-glycerol-3-phosphate acyltransferase
MRSFMKLLGIVPLLTVYLLISGTIAILPTGARLRRLFLIKNSSFFSRIMLALLGIRLHVNHYGRLQKKTIGLLIVSNHVSYIDALIIASLVPSVFITSVELGSTLFLGLLARLGGSMFVERRKASGLKKEIAMIADALEDGLPVSLFPEGTTSNGERVQPFKNSLFDAAVSAGTDILPICIRYTNVNRQPITSANRDSVFYYGGTTFFQHLPRLLALRSVDVEVMPLKTITTRKPSTRKDLASKAHEEISSVYRG